MNIYYRKQFLLILTLFHQRFKIYDLQDRDFYHWRQSRCIYPVRDPDANHTNCT